ncbi:MAG: NYN domain-containing protein [Oscillospiraceae bacterium]
MDNDKFAVLIDAENISAEYVEGIFNEITKYGTVSYKRMYGDFTNPSLAKWNEKAIEYGIVQIHQPRYAKEKNSSDIMLVIDAMDIVHSKNVDGFCIVSSDSDFTRLVNRLCESGMKVIGMGKKDASSALKTACAEYKCVEILNDDTAEEVMEQVDLGDELAEIENAIKDIILRNESKGKITVLAEIGSQLLKKYSDFDTRNFGYTSLTTFVGDMKDFVIEKTGTITKVSLKNSSLSKEEIEKFLQALIKKGPASLGRIGQQIHEKYPTFKVQDYGYSKLSAFMLSIENIEIKKNKNNTQKVVSFRK